MTDFIIIGNTNAVTYKEVFPYLKDNKMWIGMTHFNDGMYFVVPNDYEYADTYKFEREMDGEKVMRVSTACWFTNLEHNKRKELIGLTKRYNTTDYPKYDNYDAIEVGCYKDIPKDYDGVMGVPITFMGRYCPEQFEIVGMMSGANGENLTNGNDGRVKFYVDGKPTYARVLIRRKDNAL